MLSPLLSNLVLDELDRELERRKHCFVRYADDGNISARSRRAEERVKQSITGFIVRRFKLKVNEQRSAVARPVERKFLGFSFNLQEAKMVHRCQGHRTVPAEGARTNQPDAGYRYRANGEGVGQPFTWLAGLLRLLRSPVSAGKPGSMNTAKAAISDLKAAETR